ncbi:MAG: hypothetical protein JSS66_05900 [Armatimonadetes bacterium]|nr:hypothetical protein [Armatimonadota bacterium]
MIVTLYFKNVALTRLMHNADVFESFKFLAEPAVTVKTAMDKSAADYYDQLKVMDGSAFELVAVVKGAGDVYIKPGHEVWSTGQTWAMFKDVTKAESTRLDSLSPDALEALTEPNNTWVEAFVSRGHTVARWGPYTLGEALAKKAALEEGMEPSTPTSLTFDVWDEKTE